MAWHLLLETGDQIMITSSDGITLPEDDQESCLVGLYRADGQQLKTWEVDDASLALYTAKYIVGEYYQELDEISHRR